MKNLSYSKTEDLAGSIRNREPGGKPGIKTKLECKGESYRVYGSSGSYVGGTNNNSEGQTGDRIEDAHEYNARSGVKAFGASGVANQVTQ